MSLPVDFDPNLKKSINTYFKARKGNYYIHYEGFKRDTEKRSLWTELRIGGPYDWEMSKDYYKIACEINILVTQAIADGSNPYDIDTCVAYWRSIMNKIPIYQDPVTKLNQLGCLVLENTVKPKRNETKIDSMGQISPDLTLNQIVLEGHYTMVLYTGSS